MDDKNYFGIDRSLDLSKGDTQNKSLESEDHSISNKDVVTESQRVIPREVQSGASRGTQIVVGDNKRIENGVLSSNNGFGSGLFSNDSPVVKVATSEDSSGLTVYDSSNTKRLFGGVFPDGNVKIKLSQDDKDVMTATDDELIWSSDFNTFKIVKIGTGQAPSVTTSLDGTNTYFGFNSNSYAHNLGFVPVCLAFIQDSGNYLPLPLTSNYTLGPSGGIGSISYRIIVSDTSVIITTIVVDYGGSAGATTTSALNVKYYLLRETAN